MIYSRLMDNAEGMTFIPSNVEGASGVKSSKFWTTTKTAWCIGMAALIAIVWMGTADYTLLKKVIIWIILAVAYFFIIRFILLEERYYKHSLLRRRKYQNSTSAINWGIIYCNETDAGTSVGFADGAIGCFVRLEKGSMVGQPEDYVERCFECYSAFLKAANLAGYNVKIINTMELASKDPRLEKIADSTKDETNPKLRELLELDTIYMKNLSEFTFYDTDTILLYTTNYLKLNEIVTDAIELTSPLLQGAYLSRRVMNEAEIIDLHTELNSIDYFDIVSAKNEMFENDRKSHRNFAIHSLKLKDGNEFVLTPDQLKKLNYIYNAYLHDKSIKLDIIKELTPTIVENTPNQSMINKKPIKPQKPIKQPVNNVPVAPIRKVEQEQPIQSKLNTSNQIENTIPRTSDVFNEDEEFEI